MPAYTIFCGFVLFFSLVPHLSHHSSSSFGHLAVAQFVWQLNQSFSLNTSAGIALDAFQIDLLFFPFQPEYSNLQLLNNSDRHVFAYLCFISFPPTAPNNTSFYTLAICLDSYDVYAKVQVVWTANQGNPVTGDAVSLALQSDGNLVLRTGEEVAWSSGTAAMSVARMELLFSDQDGIALILFDSSNNSVWQSADYPSDTLTNGQWLFLDKYSHKLVSWTSQTNTSAGMYSLEVHPGGLALFASFPARTPYWMWIYNDDICPSTQASLMNVSCAKGEGLYGISLDLSGVNCWVGSSAGSLVSYKCLNFSAAGSDILVNMTYLKLFPDGNVRANTIHFSLSEEVQENFPLVDMFSSDQGCNLPLSCGPYGVCRGNSSSLQCECPANSTFFRPLDSSDLSQGCVHEQPLLNNCPGTLSNEVTSTSVSPEIMYRVQPLDHFSNAFSSPLTQFLTEEDCSDGCLQNCSCLAAFWHAHAQACYHVEQMGSLQSSRNQSYIGFLKVNPPPVSPSPAAHISPGAPSFEPTSSVAGKSSTAGGTIAGIVGSVLAVIFLLSVFLFFFVVRRRRLHGSDQQSDDSAEYILNAIPGLPTKFSYAQLHAITKGFSSRLGKGGFGAVYGGTLPDGSKVAVKQLEGVRQGDKEFRSEVAIMAGIHHYNLLRLLGFCAQGVHRLLVYEYMENGSLDQWLFRRPAVIVGEGHHGGDDLSYGLPLSWDVRQKVALGTAQGMAYLHEGCQKRILHLDIKPPNILLDEEFVAKVADFGLSRLMERDKSVLVTTMRGTPGYLAPEWLKDAGSIDVKCDVFSFGMLLLEVVSGRKNSDHSVELEDKIYYPGWAYKRIAYSAEEAGLAIADELTDAKLENNEDRAQLINMITIAFLCVKDKPELRPSMTQVVKMMESGEHGDHLGASRVLQQCQEQLVFVLMSNAIRRSKVEDRASKADQASTTSSSAIFSQVISAR